MDPIPKSVTLLLQNLGCEDKEAQAKLISAVYRELRKIASHYMQKERAGNTLQATALVHEMYLRLGEQKELHCENRTHFFAIAAKLMRQILVDHARARTRIKRGGGAQKTSLDENLLFSEDRTTEFLLINDALARLEKRNSRQARIVELKFFGGLGMEEISEVIGVSSKTVKRDWNAAKAWLKNDLRSSKKTNFDIVGDQETPSTANGTESR